MKEPMKKEWKMDAYMSLKMLRNAKTVNSHMSLEHLLDYSINHEKFTTEEANTFFSLYTKLMTLENSLKKDIYEDDLME